MTINEFKAWFDGYMDAIQDESNLSAMPNLDQWLRIRAKIESVGEPRATLAQARNGQDAQTAAYNGIPGQQGPASLSDYIQQYPMRGPAWGGK